MKGGVSQRSDAPLQVDRLLRTAVARAASDVHLEPTPLGGMESLIEHPSAMTHISMPRDVRRTIGITDDLIRVSVGIEHIDDLLADMDQALAKV